MSVDPIAIVHLDFTFLHTPGPNVPEIGDEALAQRMLQFAPLVHGKDDDGTVWSIAPCDPRATAYPWDPVRTTRVDFEPRASRQTDHDCAYYGFFKPSIAEVLAQVPEDLPPECNAFLITGEVLPYISGDGHRATTVFGVATPHESSRTQA